MYCNIHAGVRATEQFCACSIHHIFLVSNLNRMHLACSVSFSEEAPKIKFVPGSAEQRGTNFLRALYGKGAFCRPFKYRGGCFLLTAQVDDNTRDKLYLGLQVSTWPCWDHHIMIFT